MTYLNLFPRRKWITSTYEYAKIKRPSCVCCDRNILPLASREKIPGRVNVFCFQSSRYFTNTFNSHERSSSSDKLYGLTNRFFFMICLVLCPRVCSVKNIIRHFAASCSTKTSTLPLVCLDISTNFLMTFLASLTFIML